MEKTNRMAQIYGYTVCLVAVIAFIICVANIVTSIIDKGDPLHAEGFFATANSPSLASFENYKMDLLKNSKNDEQKTGSSWAPDDQTLRAMYQAARTDRINQANHNAFRSIVVNGLIILISIVLFVFHWLWMRRLAKVVLTT